MFKKQYNFECFDLKENIIPIKLHNIGIKKLKIRFSLIPAANKKMLYKSKTSPK